MLRAVKESELHARIDGNVQKEMEILRKHQKEMLEMKTTNRNASVFFYLFLLT